jgi:hypothetical protein
MEDSPLVIGKRARKKCKPNCDEEILRSKRHIVILNTYDRDIFETSCSECM